MRKSEKREASEEPQSDQPQIEKFRRTGEGSAEDEDLDTDLMEALEDAEQKTLHLVSKEIYMQLTTCDEPVNISYLRSD